MLHFWKCYLIAVYVAASSSNDSVLTVERTSKVEGDVEVAQSAETGESFLCQRDITGILLWMKFDDSEIPMTVFKICFVNVCET